MSFTSCSTGGEGKTFGGNESGNFGEKILMSKKQKKWQPVRGVNKWEPLEDTYEFEATLKLDRSPDLEQKMMRWLNAVHGSPDGTPLDVSLPEGGPLREAHYDFRRHTHFRTTLVLHKDGSITLKENEKESNYEQDDGDQEREPGMFGRLRRKPKNAMPLQPIGWDDHDVLRFRKNRLVEFLLDNGPFDMNDLVALPGITNAEHMQFAQLIGYSVSGAGDLSYFDDETISEMDALAEELIEKEKNNGKDPEE